MNLTDKDLRNKLKGLRIPKPDEKAMDQAWMKASYAFKHSDSLSEMTENDTAWWLAPKWVFASGILTTLLVLLPVKYFFDSQKIAPRADNVASNIGAQPKSEPEKTEWAKTLEEQTQKLAEIQKVFPNRLKTIVTTDEGTNLVLHEKEETTVSKQPIVLEISKNGKKTKIVTSSGDSFELGESKEKFEIMVTADGKVVVVTKNFVWKGDTSETKPSTTDETNENAAGYQIKAKAIGQEM